MFTTKVLKMKTQVQTLLNNFLPAHSIEYCETERTILFNEPITTSGIVIKFKDGRELFGAASSLTNDNPLMIAAYECLERYLILEQKDKQQNNKTYFTPSNGLALHENYEKACQNAQFELIERSEVLKSWYLNQPAEALSNSNFSKEFLDEFEIWSFDFSNIEGVFVVGVFAQRREDGGQFYCGFGSSNDLPSAKLKAKKEFLTRLHFLMDQPLEPLDSIPRNTGLYHQEFYLHSQNQEYLKDWFDAIGASNLIKKSHFPKIKFKTISPSHWKDFCVVKAYSNEATPLFFGIPPKSFDIKYRYDIPHPIA